MLDAKIKSLNRAAMVAAQLHVDSLVKPLGSLGKLEDIAIQLAGIFGEIPKSLQKRQLVVFAADNGIFDEGISPVSQSVTLMQSLNMTRGKSGMCALAKYAMCDVLIVDVGINSTVTDPLLVNKKLGMGTNNFCKGAAMSRETAIAGMQIGFDYALEFASKGVQILAPGEMGKCNTASSSAVLSALTGLDPDITVGKGAGVAHGQLNAKIDCVRRGLKVNSPDPNDPIDVISKVGGFDIAAITGMFIGAAHAGIPVIIDGFISIVSAVLAARLFPNARDFMFPSHISSEKAFVLAAKELCISPYLDMSMRLGEGSGSPLAMLLMEAACRMAHDMCTFDEANVSFESYSKVRIE